MHQRKQFATRQSSKSRLAFFACLRSGSPTNGAISRTLPPVSMGFPKKTENHENQVAVNSLSATK